MPCVHSGTLCSLATRRTSWISSTVVGMTTADAVLVSHVACWKGSRNSRRSVSEVRTRSAPSAAVNPSSALESAASVTPGGSGLVETASAWLMTLSSSQEA